MVERHRKLAGRQNPWMYTHLVSMRTKQMRDPELQHCIDKCGNCQETCIATVAHCLGSGNHAEAQHIRLMLDCAEICQTAANFMLRGSNLHRYVCGTCAEICEECARSCEAIAKGDEQMKRCIESCRQCADVCRKVANVSHRAA